MADLRAGRKHGPNGGLLSSQHTLLCYDSQLLQFVHPKKSSSGIDLAQSRSVVFVIAIAARDMSPVFSPLQGTRLDPQVDEASVSYQRGLGGIYFTRAMLY